MYYDVQLNRPMPSKVFLVCGAPASGKSTYVNERKLPGDFILDLDVLRQALGAPSKTSECFQAQVLAIRELLYNHIGFNRIGAKTIWVISGLPDREIRLATAKRLNAEIVFINTPYEKCIAHAMADSTRKDKDKQRQIINEYFSKLS